jgi:hypothetical protein
MITLLWTVYLAGLIFGTVISISNIVWQIKHSDYTTPAVNILIALVCVGWAIWYMYFLH